MGDLYPTKTRLELLKGVQRGEVAGYPFADDTGIEAYWGDRCVSSRVAEMVLWGWIRSGSQHLGGETFAYELTDAGRKVLEEAGRA